MTPGQLLDEVLAGDVRGRGGAGFPAGEKWRFAASAAGEQKFVVANGDEGDPGSYIDKYLMERNPELVLEGMALAGYAVGADHGFILTRSEYPRSKPALERAVESARREGHLGDDIAGSGFDFDVTVLEGAGSYVVGEETALLACLEGLRGTVSARPPFPAERGLYGAPTVVNNVETLANIPFIALRGADAYRRAQPGRVGRLQAGLLQRALRLAPACTRSASGRRCESSARTSRAASAGASRRSRSAARSAGSCRRGSSTPRFDFEALAAEGCMVGHGSIVGFDERTDMRALARHLLRFGAHESCGKCFPCRIGLQRAHEMFAAEEPVDRARSRACWRPWSWRACAPTAAACRPRSAACWSTSPRSWG